MQVASTSRCSSPSVAAHICILGILAGIRAVMLRGGRTVLSVQTIACASYRGCNVTAGSELGLSCYLCNTLAIELKAIEGWRGHTA